MLTLIRGLVRPATVLIMTGATIAFILLHIEIPQPWYVAWVGVLGWYFYDRSKKIGGTNG